MSSFEMKADFRAFGFSAPLSVIGASFWLALLEGGGFVLFFRGKIYNSEIVIRFIIALIQQCIEAAGTEKPRYLLQVQTYMAFHTGLPGIVAPAVVCTSPHGHTIFSCCQHVETRTAPAIFNSSAMIIIFIDADMRNSERI